jgi:hypothetical protein
MAGRYRAPEPGLIGLGVSAYIREMDQGESPQDSLPLCDGRAQDGRRKLCNCSSRGSPRCERQTIGFSLRNALGRGAVRDSIRKRAIRWVSELRPVTRVVRATRGHGVEDRRAIQPYGDRPGFNVALRHNGATAGRVERMARQWNRGRRDPRLDVWCGTRRSDGQPALADGRACVARPQRRVALTTADGEPVAPRHFERQTER